MNSITDTEEDTQISNGLAENQIYIFDVLDNAFLCEISSVEVDVDPNRQNIDHQQNSVGVWQASAHPITTKASQEADNHKDEKRKYAMTCTKGTQRTNDCKVCGRKFKSRSGLNRHKFDFHQGRKFTCDICGDMFTRKVSVSRHKIRVHS